MSVQGQSIPPHANERDPARLPLVALGSPAAREAVLIEALPRHRHSLSRDAVRASQAVRILIAITEVAADKGYAATSVRDIARRAGVSQKTFYEIFENKEDAFLAAYAAIDAVIERITAAGLAESEPRAMVHAGLRAYLETLAAEPAATRFFVIEAVGAGPRVLERRAAAFRAFAAALGGPLPDVDPDLLLVVVGGINELILEHLVSNDASTLPTLAPKVTAIVDRICFRGAG